MEKFDIIRGALNKLSVPFDESNFYSDAIYNIANKEYDSIMFTAFAGTNISVNTAIANLNESTEDPIIYNGVTYRVYMIPDNFLYLNDKPKEDIIFARNRILRAGSGTFTINYTKTNDVTKLNPTVRKYLEYYLASELAPTINRGSLQDELFNRAMMWLERLKEAEVYNNKDVFSGLNISLY